MACSRRCRSDASASFPRKRFAHARTVEALGRLRVEAVGGSLATAVEHALLELGTRDAVETVVAQLKQVPSVDEGRNIHESLLVHPTLAEALSEAAE